MKYIRLFEDHSFVQDVENFLDGFDCHSVQPGENDSIDIRFNTLGDMDRCQRHLNDNGINTLVDDTHATLTIDKQMRKGIFPKEN